jgi:hypothetical protein
MKIRKHIIEPCWGDIKLTKHKSFEYQLEFKRFVDQPFELSLSCTKKQDHAGMEFTFSIYKLFWLNLKVYDKRHWDHDQQMWVSLDDTKREEIDNHLDLY